MDLITDIASEAVPWLVFVGYIIIAAKLNKHVEGHRAFREYEQRRLMESRRRLRHLYYR